MSGNNEYGKFQHERYVHLLGCWTFVNPTDAVKRRDPNDYKELLLKLITANKTRYDRGGQWEIQAAIKALEALNGNKNTPAKTLINKG